MLIVNKNKEGYKKNKIQFIDLINSLELVSRRERKISEEALKKLLRFSITIKKEILERIKF